MNRKLCAPADKAQSWKSVDWKKAEAYVKKLQMRIVKAQKGGHYNKVKSDVYKRQINEGAARRAKEMNSFSDYKEGSATAEYRAMVDKAAAIALSLIHI